MTETMKKCPVCEYCGGCSYQAIPYEKQLEIKQQKVEELLSSFHKVSRIIGMDDPYHYRNKVQLSYGYDEDHRVISGYYIEQSHIIVPVEECQLADEGINRILSSVKKTVSKLRIPVYDERNMKGCLRHVLVRSSTKGEYMVVLVTATENLPKRDQFISEIIRYNPEVKTIIHSVNPGRTSKVLGNRNQALYGKGYITDTLCSRDFRISASSFYQVNKRQTEVLYRKAIEAAKLKEDEVLLDAYCGTGTIGLTAASQVKKVIGIELNRDAVRNAWTNAKINGISNAQFICDDAGRYMEQLAKENIHIDTVIMDPPRSGSDKRFMSSMVKLSPEKIVYVSCNPYSLKEDLGYLTKYYDVKSITPVDMFPFTDHVETIVLLERC